MAQVAGLLAAAGPIEQVKSTVPVYPPAGVKVIVAVFPVVAPAWKEIAPLFANAKLGGVFTVTPTGVEDVIFPVAASVPVTVIVYAPGVVFAVVLIVSVPVAAVVPAIVTELVTLHAGAEIPPGGLVNTQVRFTVPVNPPAGVTVMVDVFPLVAPGRTETLPPLLNVKLGPVLVTCAFRPSV
jgi:hypothetical protein